MSPKFSGQFTSKTAKTARHWKQIVAAATLVAGLAQVPAQAKERFWNPTTDQLYKVMVSKLDSMLTRTDMNLEIGERGRLYAWTWGYVGRAALYMHEATGEDRFLYLVRSTIDRLMDHRDDALGQPDELRGGATLPSWQTKFPWGGRSNEITTAGLITLPMCQYALKTGDHRIGREAVKTLELFINERKEAHGGYYFWHDSQGEVEALNHAHIYGTALAHCSKLSYAPESFTQTALGIYRYWRHFTRPDGKGLSWPYMPGPDSPQTIKSEAFWKYGVTIELPIALVKLGIMEDDGIMAGIRDTFTKNSVVQAGGIPQFIGEQKVVDMTTKEKFHGRSQPGLISPVVLMDDPDATRAFVAMVDKHRKLFPRGWFGGSKSMLMTKAYLLAKGMPKAAPKKQARKQASNNTGALMACDTALRQPFLFSTHAEIHRERLGYIERRLKSEQYTTIGIGDSIMQRWPAELLKKSYGGKLLNAGVGGDGIPQMMHRLRTMGFAGQSPKKVIIHIGTNDFPRKASGCAVANGIGDVITEVRTMWPQVDVTVHSILPRGNYVSEFADRIKIANDAVRSASTERNFTFIDLAAPYALRCSDMVDCDIIEGKKDIHPNLTAYDMMADIIEARTAM